MKIFKRIFSIFCTLFFVLSAFLMISSIVTSSSGQPANIGGYYVFVVASDSMTPTLKVNDIFIAKKGNDPQKGDIITYISSSGTMKGQLITHRLETIEEVDGETYYYCRGDKEGAPLDAGVKKDEIVAVYVNKVTVLSFIYRVLTNFWGFFFIIICPIIWIFATETYKLIKNIKMKDVPNNKVTMSEEEKQKYLLEVKNQILEEMKNESNKKNG